MMSAAPLGHGPLHRLPPSAKLGALFALSIVLFLTPSPGVLAFMAGAVLCMAILLAREALVHWLKAWPLLATIGVVTIWTGLVVGFEPGLVALLRLGTLSLVATMVTTTTSAGQFIDTITALARPLEKIGLADARDIGLAIGLVIRFVPDMQARYISVLAAHRARGLKMSAKTFIVPMLIGTLKSADEIADAIDARGIRTRSHHQE